jgi:hypothetical protein
MRYLLLGTVLLLPSCGIYTKLNEAVDRVDLATQKADQALQGVEQGLVAMGEKGEALAAKVAEIRAAVGRADANSDGRVSGIAEWTDLIYQLLAILGIGGYAVTTNAKRRQNVAALYTEIDALKDRVRVAELPPVR